MFLVHYAVLAACFALSQVSDYAGSPNQVLPPSPAPAQQAAPQSTTRSGDPAVSTVLVPQQIHKVEPPSPAATAQELEDSGDDLRTEKAFADALDYYHAAMAKADSAVLHNKVGITYLQMMRKNEAKREFERALKLNKEYAEPYNNLGALEYYFNHNYGKAIKQYQQAIKLKDDSASFYSNLGTAYFAQKKYEQAAQEYTKALALDPDIFERKSRGGISVQLAGTTDRAKYEYVMAKMYAGFGNLDRCLVYLRKSMEDGYSGINDVYKDREFATLRKDPRFAALMASRSKVLQIPPDQQPPQP
ncbi:MAG TPA: tetratricopeptide repeat protein [Terriglobales bacterium]|nr:tetratricopeptide repeat protein [Terriglobales bacterium]